MSAPVLHRAGEPHRVRGVQFCDACGTILKDYRNAMAPEPWEPHWWEPGSLVTVGDGWASAAKDPKAVLCWAVSEMVDDIWDHWER